MSLQRSASSATAVTNAIFKFGSPSLARACPLTTRTLSSSATSQFSARRKLMTESTYRSHSFEFPPPPPRNKGVPDSSITCGDSSTVPHSANSLGDVSASIELPTSSISETRKHDTNAARNVDAAAPSAEPTKPKRKLRARKAAMTLTPTAVEHLKELLEMPDPKLIRVGVKNRGCSGLAYHLEYVDKASTFDEILEQDGVKVLIDSKALFSIIGSEMDWMEDKLSQRFVFKNPNIKEQCGCGESFSVG